ncbi:MAG TPA: hypothetical protein VFZ13_03425 [Gemmatimonadales bacterium]
MPRAMLIVCLLLVASSASAQGPRASLLPGRAAATSWGADSTTHAIHPGVIPVPLERPRRIRNALIGGVIGATAGAVVCTAISTIADDSASDRISTCTWKGYLLLGSIGFAAGFGIGLAI